MIKDESLPLISIIVPVYNARPYLEKCLDSICRQTYKNLEIIVVDDGSTDGSGEICDSYAQSDFRVKVIHQLNAGQSVARNKALSIAQGEFLGFVDSDDWIDEDMYDFLHQLILESKADIAICSHYIEKQGKTKVRYASGEKTVFSHDEAIRALVVDRRVRNYLWDKLFKRQLFKDILFPTNRVFEDVAISYRVFYQAKSVAMKQVPKYHYLMRDGSTMHGKYDPLKEYDLFLSVYEQVNFVLDKGIWNEASVYVVKRGIRLIDHILMLEPSCFIDKRVKDILIKMHEFDSVDCFRLGISLSLKRYLIYYHRNFYRMAYRFVRSVFKSKRHQF